MLLPIGDDDRKLSGPAVITILLVAANVAVYYFLQNGPDGEAFTAGFSIVPREITTGEDLTGSTSVSMGGQQVDIPQAPGPTPIYLTILTSMFMHGGIAHILGNMLYLWIFGDNVEHRFGKIPFLGLYLATGIVGALTQIILSPDSTIPMLGASGAISGVLGAYMVLFPRNRVHFLFFFAVISIPAIVAIGGWIALQFLNGYGAIIRTQETGGVAYAAHIGGFVSGMVLATFMRFIIKAEKPSVIMRAIERDPRAVRYRW